jgi:hypothetical protein
LDIAILKWIIRKIREEDRNWYYARMIWDWKLSP